MLEALLGFLSLAATLIRREAPDSEKVAAAVTLIGIAGDLYDSGALTVTKLQQLKNTVQAMVDEDRNPTPEEFAALRERSDAAHGRIQGADLGAGDTPSQPETGDSGPPAADSGAKNTEAPPADDAKAAEPT